jgi:hypothetical protein
MKMSRARDISAAISSSIFANYAAYGQFNIIAGAVFGSGFFKLPLNETAYSKNISISSGSLLFAQTGHYSITVGFRYGSGTDTWNGVRLFNGTSAVGTSWGSGQDNSNDAAGSTFNMIARIANSAISYDLQGFRDVGTWSPATPNTNAGRFLVCTINKVGEL